MKILYILSDILPYDLLICNDAGPNYALSMGWHTTSISQVDGVINSYDIVVIDNRINESELNAVYSILKNHPEKLFFFKIVDPYFENFSHFYYKFLESIANIKNAFLLSVYDPIELTAAIKRRFDDRFIHLPYPYIKDNEVNQHPKKNKILISGALNAAIYPYRYSIWKRITRSVARVMFSILPHPGYAELSTSRAFNHNFVGSNYIDHLSKFEYVLLCPSRCGIEFLKFNECAYAGSIPVGEAPHSYPGEIKNLFLRLRSKYLLIDTLRILFKSHEKNTVSKFRDFLFKKNNPETLNDAFKKFIFEHTSILHKS